MTAPEHPRRAKDPTAAQIRRRAAEVRAGWSVDVEESRKVEKCAPIIYVALVPQDGLTQLLLFDRGDDWSHKETSGSQ